MGFLASATGRGWPRGRGGRNFTWRLHTGDWTMQEQYNLDNPSLTNLRNPSLRKESLLALGTFGALTAGSAVLHKPPFQPPSWVFAPVWTVLYGLMSFSAWRVWNRPAGPKRSWALALWGVQLGFNALWSPLFFPAHPHRAALAGLSAPGVRLPASTARARKR